MYYWFFYVCMAMPSATDFCVPFIQPKYEMLYKTEEACLAILDGQVNAGLNSKNYVHSDTCLKNGGAIK